MKAKDYQELEKLDLSKDCCITFYKLENDVEWGEISRGVKEYEFKNGKEIEVLFTFEEFTNLLFISGMGFQELMEDKNGSFLTGFSQISEMKEVLKILSETNNNPKVLAACSLLQELIQNDNDISNEISFSFREKIKAINPPANEITKPTLPKELVKNIINLINEQWEYFNLENTDRIETSRACVRFDLSKENEYFQLLLYNNIGNDSIIIEYKELNEIVPDFEIKICLNSEMILLINKDLINISKIFACDDSLPIVLGNTSDEIQTHSIMNYFLELYKNNRITLNSDFQVCIDSIDLVQQYSDAHPGDEKSYPAFLIYDHICDLLFKERGIKF